jgi:hypothetical protein
MNTCKYNYHYNKYNYNCNYNYIDMRMSDCRRVSDWLLDLLDTYTIRDYTS